MNGAERNELRRSKSALISHRHIHRHESTSRVSGCSRRARSTSGPIRSDPTAQTGGSAGRTGALAEQQRSGLNNRHRFFCCCPSVACTGSATDHAAASGRVVRSGPSDSVRPAAADPDRALRLRRASHSGRSRSRSRSRRSGEQQIVSPHRHCGCGDRKRMASRPVLPRPDLPPAPLNRRRALDCASDHHSPSQRSGAEGSESVARRGREGGCSEGCGTGQGGRLVGSGSAPRLACLFSLFCLFFLFSVSFGRSLRSLCSLRLRLHPHAQITRSLCTRCHRQPQR